MKYKGLAIGFKGMYSYIYIWYSKEHKIVYVGQTNDKNAVLGRAIAHSSEKGTLRKRCLEQGVRLDDVDDFILLSYNLPNKKIFTGVESSYRLAVEYKVQSIMHSLRGDLKPPFKLISKVTYTDHASNPNIVRIAQDIVNDFIKTYSVV